MNDCGSCCLSCCCPCIQYGLNVEKLDGSSCAANCCLYYLCLQISCCCLVHAGKRTALRARYGLQEDCCNDCCVTWLCACCAIAQEAREMQVRGPPPVMTMGSPVVIMQQAPPQQITYAQQQYGQPQQGYQSTQQTPYQQPPTYQQGYQSDLSHIHTHTQYSASRETETGG